MSTLNGRVPDISVRFAMQDRIPVDNRCTDYREGNINPEQTPTSVAYFSGANQTILQNAIRRGVYEQSNHQFLVGPQDCGVLKQVMRSIFESYGPGASGRAAIVAMNALVVQYCVNSVFSEAVAYQKYLADVGKLAVPMAHPVMAKTDDRAELEFKGWF